LSAANAKLKPGVIGSGSGVNVRGGTKSWDDVGTAATFRVGPDELRFGEFLDRLQHPTLAEGYLPIPEICYAHDRQVYKLEAFVATEPELAENAMVFVKLSLASGTNNFITVEFDSPVSLSFAEGKVTNAKRQVLAYL